MFYWMYFVSGSFSTLVQRWLLASWTSTCGFHQTFTCRQGTVLIQVIIETNEGLLVFTGASSYEVQSNDRSSEDCGFSEIIFSILIEKLFLEKTIGSVIQWPYFLTRWPWPWLYICITPKTMLFSLYIFNVFAMGYVVFALERAYGTCMEYIDVVWLVAVTLTNLGYGEFTPS